MRIREREWKIFHDGGRKREMLMVGGERNHSCRRRKCVEQSNHDCRRRRVYKIVEGEE